MRILISLLLLQTLAFAQTDIVVNGKTIALSATATAQAEPHLITSGQPSANDLTALAAAGVGVLIDLRGTQEDRGFDEVQAAQQLGLHYIGMPINGAADITFDNAQKLHQLLQQQGDKTVLLHCHSSNRVGALLALRAKQLGQSNEQALAVGKAAGLKSLEAAVLTQMGTK